jgi:hypothetical protein
MEYGTPPPRPAGRRPIGLRSPKETETKQAFKTTEFWIYVVIVLGILIAGLVADAGDDSVDGFGAERVWLYIVILSGAYMVSRGLAKSGSRDPYVDSPDSGSGDSIADRAKAAAQVLKGDAEASTSHHDTPTEQGPRY